MGDGARRAERRTHSCRHEKTRSKHKRKEQQQCYAGAIACCASQYTKHAREEPGAAALGAKHGLDHGRRAALALGACNVYDPALRQILLLQETDGVCVGEKKKGRPERLWARERVPAKGGGVRALRREAFAAHREVDAAQEVSHLGHRPREIAAAQLAERFRGQGEQRQARVSWRQCSGGVCACVCVCVCVCEEKGVGGL